MSLDSNVRNVSCYIKVERKVTRALYITVQYLRLIKWLPSHCPLIFRNPDTHSLVELFNMKKNIVKMYLNKAIGNGFEMVKVYFVKE